MARRMLQGLFAFYFPAGHEMPYQNLAFFSEKEIA